MKIIIFFGLMGSVLTAFLGGLIGLISGDIAGSASNPQCANFSDKGGGVDNRPPECVEEILEGALYGGLGTFAIGVAITLSVMLVYALKMLCSAAVDQKLPRENTKLLPSQDNIAEPKETCCERVGRCLATIFAKKHDAKSANDLEHAAHSIHNNL